MTCGVPGIAAARRATVRICDETGKHCGQGLLVRLEGEQAAILTCHHVVAPLSVEGVHVAILQPDGQLGLPVSASYDPERSQPERDAVVLRLAGEPDVPCPRLHKLDPTTYSGLLAATALTHLQPGSFNASIAAAAPLEVDAVASGSWPSPPDGRYRLPMAFRLANPTDSRDGISGAVVLCEDGVLGLAHFARVESAAAAREAYLVPLTVWAERWPALASQIVPIPWGPVRKPPPGRAAVLRMEEDYAAMFGGRREELAVLDQFLNTADPSYLLILARSGRGKTALLFRWIALVRQRGDWAVVFHPLSLRYGTATAGVALPALAAALAEVHGVALEEYSGDPGQMRSVVADLLRREPPPGRRLLVVLDGLDEAEAAGWEVDRSLFPRRLPSRLKIVASSRNLARRSHQSWLDRLGWPAAQTCFSDLSPLDRGAVAEVLELAFPESAALVGEVYRISQGDPLTVRYLVEALQSRELSPGALMALPSGLEAFVEHWLSDLDEEARRDQEVDLLLGLLAVALAPLSSGDLHTLAPELARSAIERGTVRKAQRFILGDGSRESGYVLDHPRLREVFLDRLSVRERKDLSERFVRYGRDLWARRSEPPPEYVRLCWIKHLADAGEWRLAEEVLTGFETGAEGLVQPWSGIRFESEGSYSGYLGDLDLLWTKAEREGRPALAFRCALLVATLRSLSANLPRDLLVDLLTVGTPEGRWTATAVLEAVRQMPESHSQALALQALCEGGGGIPGELALEVASTIRDESWRAAALGSVAPLLPDVARVEAAAIASGIADPAARAVALCHLLPQLSGPLREGVLSQAEEAARTAADPLSLVEALTSFAPHTSEARRLAIWREALETAISIGELAHRWQALEKIASGLPMDLVPLAVEATRALGVPGRRADVFHAMLEHLPAPVREEAWWDTLEAFASESSHWLFGGESWLAASAGGLHLSPEGIRRWLERARAIEEPTGRALALAAITPSLEEDLRERVWLEVAQAVSLIVNRGLPSDTSPKAATWAQILPRMPRELQARFAADALEASLGPFSGCHRDERDAFCDIVACLPEKDLPAALGRAREQQGAPFSKRLVHLGRRLGYTERRELLAEALRAAQRIGDTGALAQALGALAPALPPTARERALRRARRLEEPHARFAALKGFTGVIPADVRLQRWKEILDTLAQIPDDWSRAAALEEIGRELPEEYLGQALALGQAMRHIEARARALSALADRLPVREAFEVWRNVFEAGWAVESYLGPALSRLQARLRPQARKRVWNEVLRASIALDNEYHRELALRGLAPHLPPSLLVSALDAVEHLNSPVSRLGRSQILEDLLPRLPEKLRLRALRIARSESSWSRTRLLGALASRPRETQRDDLLEEAIQTLEEESSDFDRSHALEGLARHLTPHLLPRALRIAGEIRDPEQRAAALIAFGPALPVERLPVALESALASADWSRRARLLGSLALLLAEAGRAGRDFAAASPSLWTNAVRRLAYRGRDDLLRGLAELAPWSAGFLSPEAAEGILDAILDGVACWP